MNVKYKSWYTSKSIWGCVFAILSIVLGALGYSMSAEETEELVLAFTAIGGALGGVVGIYGRVTARERVR